MRARVVVVPTGTANTASVLAAFRRLGCDPTIAVSPLMVSEARHVVVPGVGAFGAAMEAIDRVGMREVIVDRIDAGRSTLAVCVGMQLLAAKSQESPTVAGLAVVETEVTRFKGDIRVPQLGWNQVETSSDCRYLVDGWAYFANSYRMASVPHGWSGAIADHGGEFVASMERGQVLACQFHPELSGGWGSKLLERWLKGAA